jgi:hypothetical protein
VFLADANALSVPRDHLLQLLFSIRCGLPMRGIAADGYLDGIYSFLDVFIGRRRSPRMYAELREHGLRRVYLGVESGCDELLRFVRKPQTRESVRDEVAAIKEGGLDVGVILMVGVGGERFDERHVADTIDLARSLPWTTGDRVFLSSFFEVEGTEYPVLARASGIRPLDPSELERQYEQLAAGLRTAGCPRVVPYSAEEFVY